MAAEEKRTYKLSDALGAARNVVPLSAVRPGAATPAVASDEDQNTGDQRVNSASAKQIWTATKILAGGLLIAWLVAWPIGTTMVHQATTGTFAIRLGYSGEVFLLAISSAALILGAGYAVSAGARLEAAAQRLHKTFSGMGEGSAFPQSAAARAQISALNAEIDTAIGRLAEAESLIRQQVRAIDNASSALESGTVKSTERLEKERRALMDLAEEMNQEAERFAEKIAERSNMSAAEQGSYEARIVDKERELSSQLQRLEAVSAKSLDRFEQLASAMEDRSENLTSANAEATERQSAIANRIDENAKRLSTVQTELAEQSARLEALIKDQRKRADRLAKIVTEQAGRMSATPSRNEAPAPENETAVGANRRRLAWRDILATVEEALPGQDDATVAPQRAAAPVAPAAAKPAPVAKAAAPAPQPAAPKPTPPKPAAPKPLSPAVEQAVQAEKAAASAKAAAPKPSAQSDLPDEMDRLISRIHNFSLVMYTQLVQEPTHDQLDRYERGERQIFARLLVAGDTEELKSAATEQVVNNPVFKQRVAEYLNDFDTLLEPLSADEDGEAAIESYLSAPIGRLYVLTGSAVGHFS
ncbi:hypothetical protein [Parvularcula sp. LCG005]|uniref:hypothetical protein n=1 Tax=Parvularcula sp. LCG005 TaxID=3078805 RepID=UPI002941FE2D|nr:hypothetical protein [Parvularcula sp. LCG005]WOI54130.1 hypothetical protein RUI03_03795 [Parvularcula sp. LCG005]